MTAPSATAWAWRHVADVGPALAVTLLAVAREVDKREPRARVTPERVAEMTGGAPSTVARHLHTLAERELLTRSASRATAGSHVAYAMPTAERFAGYGAMLKRTPR